MTDIVLCTLNARYVHCAFGLRYLLANLGPLRSRARIIECTIDERPADVAELLLAEKPRIIGLGVYIWNARQTHELVALLKTIAPEVLLVLGGPEVSYETGTQPLCQLADAVVCGEGDRAFGPLCERLLAGERPASPFIAAPLPDTATLELPYHLYSDTDLKQRVVYVEASRGCPFRCEFCLSALDIPLRSFPLASIIACLQSLLDRGLRQFKFVDRTFNLSITTSLAILRFFRERYQPGLFLHFEMIPDRLPEALRTELAAFPDGAVQLEIGIQTFNPEVGRRISRKQNLERLRDNLTFLRNETGVHLHTDLIAGLPGEDLASFAAGFDQLVALRPHEIQLGILKRLRGTPIVRHEQEFSLRYNPEPPYEIVANRDLDFGTLQRLKRFARYWDLIANSGNFRETCPHIWGEGSAFEGFLALSDWLFEASGRTHGIALTRLAGLLFQYLTEQAGGDPHRLAPRLLSDYRRGGRRDVPVFLRRWLGADRPGVPAAADTGLPKRQARFSTALEEGRS